MVTLAQVVDVPFRFVWARLGGSGELGARHELLEDALNRCASGATRLLLVDARAIHAFRDDPVDVLAVAAHVAGRLRDFGIRIAWLVNYDFQLDSAFETALRTAGVMSARFRSRELAMGWLGAEQSATVDAPVEEVAPVVSEAEPPAEATASLAREIAGQALGRGIPVDLSGYAKVVLLICSMLEQGVDAEDAERFAGRMIQALSSRPAGG